MKLRCDWNDRMVFTAAADAHSVKMDTKPPLGADSAMTPKQLLVAGVCGCTGMDVVALLKKNKEPLEGLQVEAEATPTTGVHPAVFQGIHLTFRLRGALDPERVKEAVTLSQTQYCGVSAMVSKAVPISYTIELNGQPIGTGEAKFK